MLFYFRLEIFRVRKSKALDGTLESNNAAIEAEIPSFEDINSRYDFCCLIVMYNNCAPISDCLIIRDLRVISQILTICWTSLYCLVMFIVFKGASIYDIKGKFWISETTKIILGRKRKLVDCSLTRLQTIFLVMRVMSTVVWTLYTTQTFL